jgi:hypothetical protein
MKSIIDKSKNSVFDRQAERFFEAADASPKHFARAAVAVLLLTTPANAGEAQPPQTSRITQKDINNLQEVGAALLCDTRTQVERFVSLVGLLKGDEHAAINTVNKEANDLSACVVQNVAFIRASESTMARNGDQAFEIVRVLVVGVEKQGRILPVKPVAYHSAFGVKEYGI